MEDTESEYAEGGCSCGRVRYRLNRAPMFVHCCHCSWCQRGSGSAFAINALIEADCVELLQGQVEVINTPTASGKGQKISRCPVCKDTVWSNFSGAGNAVHFVRAGTLDAPGSCPPDIHIFTSTKLPWLALTDGKPVMEEFYRYRDYWPEKSIARLLATRDQ